MALKRVTMQDIADACALSRNTVSKIFNHRGAVPEATRRRVLQKAQELGYFQLPEQNEPQAAPRQQSIAIMTSKMPKDYHFAILFLPVFTERLGRAGYTITIYQISPEELRARRLPPRVPLEQTAGILGIELFDRDYLDMLCGLNLPVLSVDAPVSARLAPVRCDLVLMENTASAFTLTRQVIQTGAVKLGFVGDTAHCRSFHERWLGFQLALEEAELPLNKRLCILADDAEPYDDTDWLAAQLRRMPAIPDAFICATDFLAYRLIDALRQIHLSVPADVMVTGFDDNPQSAVMEPSLTTVQIPNADFGRIAAGMLLDRIGHPELPFRTTYISTTPVWRKSTRC